MNYIEIVNDAIQYIESNLHRKLSLKELASRYYMSPTYFYRIFRAVTSQTVRAYILGRKLSAAAIALKRTDHNVADIAFKYGFNSHEVFTRNFLRMFHVSPSRYRKENISVSLMEKMDVIQRDFKNENRDITVDYCCQELGEIRLLGREVHFHPEVSCEMEDYMHKCLNFGEKSVLLGSRFFNITRVDHSDPSRLFCFHGIATEEYMGDRSGLAERIIPKTKYAIFKYPEGMGIIFRTVMNDLKQWFNVAKLEFNDNADFNMFELYPNDFLQTGIFYLCVPVL